jgi:putative (di)nucleoside polyphosphate hydrolase
MIDPSTLPYRPAAAVMLLNAENKVWVGQRIDSTLAAWQMPQGGLDEGEEPIEGALRELEEETGIVRDLVEILAQAPEPKYYDLPDDLIGKVWKGRYRGQRQHWFLARFLGTDADVLLETAEPEFRAWRWVDAEQVPLLIVPFKQALYRSVLEDFLPLFP